MTRKGNKYIILTFIFSWIMWAVLGILSYNNVTKFGQPLFWIFFILGGNGPFIVALIVNFLGKEKGYKELIKQFLKVKVNLMWYLFVLIIPLLYFSIPWIINLLSKGTSMKLFRGQILMILTVIPLNIVCGGSEELGWRGVLLPELLKQFLKVKATIILGTIWGLWHLPLFFIKSSPQENGSFVFFLLTGISLSFLLTALYTRTKSIFLCVLFHALINSYPYVLNIPIHNIYRESFVMLIFSVLVFTVFEMINSNKSKTINHNID